MTRPWFIAASAFGAAILQVVMPMAVDLMLDLAIAAVATALAVLNAKKDS